MLNFLLLHLLILYQQSECPRRLRFSEGDASMQPELGVDIPTADTVSTDVITENLKEIEQVITPDQGAFARMTLLSSKEP